MGYGFEGLDFETSLKGKDGFETNEFGDGTITQLGSEEVTKITAPDKCTIYNFGNTGSTLYYGEDQSKVIKITEPCVAKKVAKHLTNNWNENERQFKGYDELEGQEKMIIDQVEESKITNTENLDMFK